MSENDEMRSSDTFIASVGERKPSQLVGQNAGEFIDKPAGVDFLIITMPHSWKNAVKPAALIAIAGDGECRSR